MKERTFEGRLAEQSETVRRREMIDQALRPPEPQLLDTCILQNLEWIDRQIEVEGSVTWDDASLADLTCRYGADHADDLIDLGTLYKTFEYLGGYPWMICEAAETESSRLRGPKQARLGELSRFFRGHQEDWGAEEYPGIAPGLLFVSRPHRVSPLILRSLGVSSAEEVYAAAGPLNFLPDPGDRVVAAHALMANIPVVVTTDRATFWRHRKLLEKLGLRAMRPSELLQLYIPYWDALETELRT